MNARRHYGSPLRLILGYRDRLRDGVRHDIRHRYGGSVLGVAWAVLAPLLQLCMYATLYAFVFRVRPEGLGTEGYVLLVVSGMVPLLAFNEALVAAMNSLSANRALLLNTVFPAELIPLRAAVSVQVPGLVGLCVAAGLSVWLGRGHWTAPIIVPAVWVLMVMFATGIGWVLSLITLVAKDLQHAIGLVTMLLFVCSPFAYTPEMVPSTLREAIWCNPLSCFVVCFQAELCHGTIPPVGPLVGAVLLGLGSFFGGFAMFQRMKAVFFDHA
jgi:lipopolysaccharide transport system permease protein